MCYVPSLTINPDRSGVKRDNIENTEYGGEGSDKGQKDEKSDKEFVEHPFGSCRAPWPQGRKTPDDLSGETGKDVIEKSCDKEP
ncbi:MAG: hypothetical protein AMXMBFR16_12830 [Candidatus Uhrbacteria bacterium]